MSFPGIYAPSSQVLKVSVFWAVVYTLTQPLKLPSVFYVPLLCWGGFCLTQGRRGAMIYSILLVYLMVSFIQFSDHTKICVPFLPDRITAIEGKLIQEPSWSSRGNLILSLSMSKAFTGNPQEVGAGRGEGEAEGVITLFLSGEEAFKGRSWMRGDEVLIAGKMTLSEMSLKQSGLLFFGDRIIRYSRINADPFRIWILKKVYDASENLGGLSEVLLPALVLGLKHPDQESLNHLFRETGTAHIVALSGFHSGLVALLLFSVFRFPLGFRKAMVLSAAGLLVYLYLAGIKPSLLRAVIMYLIPVSARLFYKRVDLIKVLTASFLLTGLIIPESLHTLSAGLSYLALWGILYTGPLVHSCLKPRIGSLASLGLSASLSAQFWTLPLVLISFGQWYPSGIPASIVLTPLITVYMYSGIFLIFIQDIPLLSLIPAALCRIVARGLPLCAGVFGKIPRVSMAESRTGLFLILLFPLLLGAVYRPGGFCGKRKSESELRFHIRNKGSSGHDGAWTPKKVGTEFSDQPGCPGKNSQAPGPSGG